MTAKAQGVAYFMEAGLSEEVFGYRKLFHQRYGQKFDRAAVDTF
jgi:hypothetical protein